jgi:hypothetical protein
MLRKALHWDTQPGKAAHSATNNPTVFSFFKRYMKHRDKNLPDIQLAGVTESLQLRGIVA